MQQGKVWLVGAGPGDVGLLTLKGKQVLEQADVVVYDSLVGASILALIPGGIEQIDVGKRASHHILPQAEISQVLCHKAKEGKQVVRLKGGDPFLFGRGGEELELLEKEGIPYEVVPGVTSAFAVPAYNGIPVTHRDYCSSVHVITGHQRAGNPLTMDFQALVQTKGTLVFLMGVSALPDICNGLLEAGMDPHMPAAILQQGTTAGQRRIVATLETLPEESNRQGIQTPAIIVVGKVCTLAKELAWMESRPLFGHRVIVTRPRQLNSVMAEKLRKQGAEVLELPTIETKAFPLDDQIKRAVYGLEQGEYAWLVFTSPTGVRIFLEDLKQAGKDIRLLGKVKLAAIGQGTKQALWEAGLGTDLIPAVYDGIHLGQALCQTIIAETRHRSESSSLSESNLSNQEMRILIPRAKEGNEELIAEILQANKQGMVVTVKDLAIYETSYRTDIPVPLSAYLTEGPPCTVCFTSASTVRGFYACLQGQCGTKRANALMKTLTAACIGKQTATSAEHYGMQCVIAKEATMDSLERLIRQMREDRFGKE